MAARCGWAATFHLTATLDATHGKILSQSPTDATRFWWHLYVLTEETMDLPLGCLQGGLRA